MRKLPLLLLLALPAQARPVRPDADAIRTGLLAAGRQAREQAAMAARGWARTDPAGVAELWEGVDLRGRCLLVRALASAGTRHAAAVALERVAAAPEPEVFTALLEGLPEGGEKAIFAPLPASLSPSRRAAVEALRLRWRLEAELVRLKSPSGPTGSYDGQFKRVKALGPGVVPIFFDIVTDRARPPPGEAGAGPFRPIHPGMVRFEPQELRGLAANAFGEVVDPADRATVRRLERLFQHYWELEGEETRFEREDLAPTLSFSLHDLGVSGPARAYIARLGRRAKWGPDALGARWELGYACIRTGRYEEGERWYEEVLDSSYSKAIAAYNLACNFSMRAKREPRRRALFKRKAIRYLWRAIHEFGYGDWKWMEEDGDLDFVRDEAGYGELLQFLQMKYPDRKKGRVSKDRREFLGDGK